MISARSETRHHCIHAECDGREYVNRVHVEALPAFKVVDCFGMNDTPVDDHCEEVHYESEFHCDVECCKALPALINAFRCSEVDAEGDAEQTEEHGPVREVHN